MTSAIDCKRCGGTFFPALTDPLCPHCVGVHDAVRYERLWERTCVVLDRLAMLDRMSDYYVIQRRWIDWYEHHGRFQFDKDWNK